MRKALLLAVLTLSLEGCAFLEPQPPIDLCVSPGAPPAGRIWAGAARVALTPVDHAVPLAGFGPFPHLASETNKDELGEPEELYARALSLRGERPIDEGLDRIVLVSIDQLLVTAAFRKDVLERFRALASPGESEGTAVVLCATHTHFGIGGFWQGWLPESLSIGSYEKEITERTSGRVAQAILAAIRAERPARLASGKASLPQLVTCRAFGKSAVDPELLALALDGEDGAAIARLVVFAAHPTELYGEDRLSPAWPGACSRELERRGGVALVLQGGVGDQKPEPKGIPAFFDRPYARQDGADQTWFMTQSARRLKSRAYGEAIASAVSSSLVASPRARVAVLRHARAPLELPAPVLGACPIPVVDRLLGIAVAGKWWTGETRLRVLRVGEVALCFAPFELCAETTLSVKKTLRQRGYADAAVVSLADDWLGYAPDFFPLPWTTSGLTSFGGTGMGRVVGDRLTGIAARIAPPR